MEWTLTILDSRNEGKGRLWVDRFSNLCHENITHEMLSLNQINEKKSKWNKFGIAAHSTLHMYWFKHWVRHIEHGIFNWMTKYSIKLSTNLVKTSHYVWMIEFWNWCLKVTTPYLISIKMLNLANDITFMIGTRHLKNDSAILVTSFFFQLDGSALRSMNIKTFSSSYFLSQVESNESKFWELWPFECHKVITLGHLR